MTENMVELNNVSWKKFKAKYNKTYSDEKEEIKRYKIFMETWKKAKKANRKYLMGISSYKSNLVINEFADMLPQEIYECTKIE